MTAADARPGIAVTRLLGVLGDLKQQHLELHPGGLQQVRLREPSQHLTAGNRHPLPRSNW
ncbi:hypothetical protein ACG83_11660 [Frankia sp. R43]|nr:hypothetical protein ACG83_11660 [Frankia sp. R43]